MISNKEIKKHLDSLDRRMDLMDRSLLLHNPDSPRAAEMFDGLRKSVRASLNATQVLQAGLAELDQISGASDDIQDVRVKLKELMDAASMRQVSDYDRYREAFEFLGTGPVASVARPAYVVDTGEVLKVVSMGVVELSESPTRPVPPATEELSVGIVDDATEEAPEASKAPDSGESASDEIDNPVGGVK